MTTFIRIFQTLLFSVWGVETPPQKPRLPGMVKSPRRGLGGALSKFLRHTASRHATAKDTFGKKGWYRVSTVLDKLSTIKDLDGLLEVPYLKWCVWADKKNRFSLGHNDDGELMICANQGHSFETQDLFTRLRSFEDFRLALGLCPTDTVQGVHGSYVEFRSNILDGGLLSMARTHVHVGVYVNGKTPGSGMRPDCTCAFQVQLEDPAFWTEHVVTLSVNRVLLIESRVKPAFIQEFKL